MIKKIIIFISILIYGCNSADINNKDKRNENWIYWIDEKTGEKSWVSVGNETTIKDGRYTSFYNKGTIYKKGKLKNGAEIDTIYFFDLKEKLIQYLLVKPDTLIHYYINNGAYTSYLQNGRIFEKGNIENHQIGNEWTKYFENGKIDWTKKLVNGTGWNYWYYKNGQISDQNFHLNGKTNGEVKTWYENGQVEEISNWENGIQNGKYTTFYENGKLNQISNWIKGKKEGKVQYWFDNGNKQSIYNFKNGVDEGLFENWYSNGQKKDSVNYISGKPNGKIVSYYENGKIKAEGNYEKGIREGLMIWYDKNGKITKKQNFKNDILLTDE